MLSKDNPEIKVGPFCNPIDGNSIGPITSAPNAFISHDGSSYKSIVLSSWRPAPNEPGRYLVGIPHSEPGYYQLVFSGMPDHAIPIPYLPEMVVFEIS